MVLQRSCCSFIQMNKKDLYKDYKHLTVFIKSFEEFVKNFEQEPKNILEDILTFCVHVVSNWKFLDLPSSVLLLTPCPIT